MPIDYSKWDKMKFSSSSEDEDEGDEQDGDEQGATPPETNGIEQVEGLQWALSDQTSWWKCLSEKERYEWFVDCYRMRVDDDYVWGGGNLHGLYLFDPMGPCEERKLTVVKDFLVFMKLAVKNEVIPKSEIFSFGECLKEAAALLPYAFEKSDAQAKWGGENVFSTRPSLRRTGEAVYGTSCMPSMDDNNNENKVQDEVEHGIDDKFQNSSKVLFDDVGGYDVWHILYKALRFVG